MSEGTPNTLVESDSPEDQGANAKLFALLYADLRRLADRELRRFPSAGVSPTTLVHEAYLNLAGRDGVHFADPGKCLGYVARAMRGVLIDFSRRRQAVKRGSEFKIVELNTQIGEKLSDESLTRLSAALDELAQHAPRSPKWSISNTSAASHSPKSPSCAACRNARCSAIGRRCA